MNLGLVIFVPRDRELAQFVEDALAFKPIAIRIGTTVQETLGALRDNPTHVLVVDVDALGDPRPLQTALAELDWRGTVIAVGTPTPEQREALHIDHVLAARFTSIELRNVLASVQPRVPKIAVPMRT